jgi:hypothetical protein
LLRFGFGLYVTYPTKTSEKKRQKIAKQLLKIYLDIESIVERGNEIISILKGEDIVVKAVASEKLIAQQQALQNIIYDLNNHEITSLLKLHLPKIKTLEAIFHMKGSFIAFFIKQLSTKSKLTKADLKKFRTKFNESKDIRSIKRINELDRLLEYGYHSKLPSFREGRFENEHIVVFATSNQVKNAERRLAQIAQLGEDLRLLIIDKFKLEDVL